LANLLSTKQLLELLNIDRTTVYRMLKDGRLNGIKVGNQWRFSRDEVDALLSGSAHGSREATGGKAKAPGVPEPEEAEPVPVKCIQAMQEVFAEVLGIGAITTDLDGQPITNISNSCRFCQLILASDTGRRACGQSWRKLAAVPNSKGFSLCHAGLQYAKAVVEINGKASAALITGQFYAKTPDPVEESSRIRTLAEKHDIPLADLQMAAQSLPVLSERTRSHIEKWLQKEARVIEEFSSERNQLMTRYQPHLVRI
jgi:excisionase family DNA binding protein